ncbi:MAG: hypothetical protein ACI9OB_000486 [Nonlabens sp.]|jgi:hypothetical protein
MCRAPRLVVHSLALTEPPLARGRGHGAGMWNLITQLARRQHGVVHRRQLLALGLTKDVVGGLVRRGRLERVASAVYAVAGSPCTPLREAMIAGLRCGEDARLVGVRLLAAQGVHHLDAYGPFEVLVPRGRRLPPLPWPVRIDRYPDLGVRTWVQAVPSVAPARNILEVAAGPASDATIRAVVDAYRWVYGSVDDLRGLARCAPDHVGARRIAGLGLLALDAAESEPERDLGLIAGQYGAERQVRIGGLRVDFLIRSAALVIEYDGAGHDPIKDAARDARLRALGYNVIHITKQDLRNPAQIRRRIERYLAVAAR